MGASRRSKVNFVECELVLNASRISSSRFNQSSRVELKGRLKVPRFAVKVIFLTRHFYIHFTHEEILYTQTSSSLRLHAVGRPMIRETEKSNESWKVLIEFRRLGRTQSERSRLNGPPGHPSLGALCTREEAKKMKNFRHNHKVFPRIILQDLGGGTRRAAMWIVSDFQKGNFWVGRRSGGGMERLSIMWQTLKGNSFSHDLYASPQ